MKRIPGMFSRSMHHDVQNVHFASSAAISLETLVWLPALKKRDNAHPVIGREVLSATRAKQDFANNVKGVDPWGHAAAKVLVDCTVEPDNHLELREKIRELAIVHNAVSLKDSATITGLECYLSLYPDHNKPTRGGFTPSEEQEWVDRTKTGDILTDKGKHLSLSLFNTKYPAYNSNYKIDEAGYGKPDSTLLFSRGLDFLALVEQCFEMMHPVVKGNTVVLETALPSATYFGKAMLYEHRLISNMLQNEGQPLPRFNSSTEVIHVCTTASLFLFKAGMGEDQYYNIVKKILKDNPELTHGFPISHFAYAFFNTVSQHPDYKIVQAGHGDANLSNQGNTPQKK